MVTEELSTYQAIQLGRKSNLDNNKKSIRKTQPIADEHEKQRQVQYGTAAMSSRSSFDKSGAIFTSNGGGPSSAHCISSRASCTCISSVGHTNFPCK
jgi:hypothetical protein